MTFIDICPDPAHPNGGHAVLRLPRQGEGPVRLMILDTYSERHLGASGWQAGAVPLGPLAWSEAGGGYVLGPDLVRSIAVATQLSIRLGGQEYLAIWPATILPYKAPVLISSETSEPPPEEPIIDPKPEKPTLPIVGPAERKRGESKVTEQEQYKVKPDDRVRSALIAAATLLAVMAVLWRFGVDPPPEFADLPVLPAPLPDARAPSAPGPEGSSALPPPPLLPPLPAPDTVAAAEPPPPSAPSDPVELMLALQNALQAQGCAPGRPDGEYGPASVRASAIFDRFAPSACGDLQPLESMRDRRAASIPADWIARGQQNLQTLQACTPAPACGRPPPEATFARETSRGCLYDPTVHRVPDRSGKLVDSGGLAEWTGDCVAGYISGNGSLRFEYGGAQTSADWRSTWRGTFLQGRPAAGTHEVTELSGRVWTNARDAQGRAQGRGTIRNTNGLLEAGRYENNRMVGKWEVTGGPNDLSASLDWDGVLVGGNHSVMFPTGIAGVLRQYIGRIALRRSADGTLAIWREGRGTVYTYESGRLTSQRTCVWERNNCVRVVN